MTFPTLYKKSSSTGKVQQWEISVDGATITVRHGQLGGKIQQTQDVIREGKNLGKANATTVEQQAELEAQAKHEKQLKKGYVDSPEKAQAGDLDDIIEGGFAVMLAPSELWPKHAAKIKLPAYLQPKLDGQRLVGIVEDGVASLWSRTRKRVLSLPHIEEAIAQLFPGTGRFVLDGEAYADAFAEDFEELMSIVRKNEPNADGKHLKVQYWLYDYPSVANTFSERYGELRALLGQTVLAADSPLRLVPTRTVSSHEEIRQYDDEHTAAGYEGSMVRADAPYEGGRRSYFLQKVKSMQDGEFAIVGAEEGRGKDAGTVGAFMCDAGPCKDADCAGTGYVSGHNRRCSLCSGTGRIRFSCRLKASYARRRELFEKPHLWRGKQLTVKYQKLSAYGTPIFPIGKAIRDE